MWFSTSRRLPRLAPATACAAIDAGNAARLTL
jgi:hypothetical protein